MSQSEGFMREARKALTAAHEAEVSGQIELADACGAIAANKVAAAVRLDERVHIHECQACDGGYRDVRGVTVRCNQCKGTGRRATNGGEA